MIRKIKINNFQSHKESELVFDPGLNVIVGSSDSGKTAIIMALLWALTNKPSGDFFKSFWGGDTQIELTIDENIVIRNKGTKNFYILKDLNKKNNKEFKAFGQDVQDEIKTLLNINDINFQKQHDSSFLLSDSSGEVARYLNDIVNLNKIDFSLSNVESKKRAEKSNIARLEAEEKQLEKNIKEKFINLDEIEKKAEAAEKSAEEYEKLTFDIDKLNGYVNNINAEQIKIFSFPEKIISEKELEILNNKVFDIDKLYKEIEGLKNVIEKIDNENNDIKILGEEIKESERLKKLLFPEVCPLCGQAIKKQGG